MIEPFPWALYSKKVASRIEQPRSLGSFAIGERQMRTVIGKAGSIEEGNHVALYWLVDPEDGMIVDAKFQAFGETPLIAAADAACELVIHKYYDQARRISADLLDKHLQDSSHTPAFPSTVASHLNLVIDAIENAAEQCSDIPLPEAYVSPLPHDVEVIEGGYPGFEQLNREQQIHVIEEVIKEDILPYIELDGGGVEVKNLLPSLEVIIAYQGNCTSCFSSTGATLGYIQQTLRAKVHPKINVTPDL